MFSYGIIAIAVMGALAFAGGGGGDDDLDEALTPEEPEVDPEPQEPEVDPDADARALVAGDRADGTEVDAADLVAPGPVNGQYADIDYIVRPNDTDVAAIDIEYDAQTTFRVDLVSAIGTVKVSLNTDIATEHQDVEVTHETSLAPDGSTISETLVKPIYPGPTAITYEVSAAQIGGHVPLIDLSNP